MRNVIKFVIVLLFISFNVQVFAKEDKLDISRVDLGKEFNVNLEEEILSKSLRTNPGIYSIKFILKIDGLEYAMLPMQQYWSSNWASFPRFMKGFNNQTTELQVFLPINLTTKKSADFLIEMYITPGNGARSHGNTLNLFPERRMIGTRVYINKYAEGHGLNIISGISLVENKVAPDPIISGSGKLFDLIILPNGPAKCIFAITKKSIPVGGELKFIMKSEAKKNNSEFMSVGNFSGKGVSSTAKIGFISLTSKTLDEIFSFHVEKGGQQGFYITKGPLNCELNASIKDMGDFDEVTFGGFKFNAKILVPKF